MAAASSTALLAAARDGDRRAFDALVAPHRAALHAHCYRMLGSVHDAEDAVQETLLRAWRALARFEGRSSLRSWLYTIATHASLRAIERRSRRGLPMDFGPATEAGTDPGPALAETVWIEPYPDRGLAAGSSPEARYDQRESLELAFIAAVQLLPARQRAVLLLRDVFGYSAAEVAACLETTVAAVNSALQRARRAIDQRLPPVTQQATLRSLGDARVRGIVEAYIRAWERDDVDGVVALLARDAILAMPPTPAWYAGQAAIAAFYRGLAADGHRWRHVATSANAQPAVGCYVWEERTGRFTARVLDVLTLRGDRIAAVTAFVTVEPFARLGLPDSLPA
jgi:RNA polymerase sigma-70 factor, ECF subfamily